MLIDWFTVAAQALNFLILVWLLRRFLYKPILKAIDSREQRIASELADAAAKQADANKEREDFQKKNGDFEQQRGQLLTRAADEADARKQQLLGEAREAADAMSSQRLEALNNDARTLDQAITRRTQDEVFSIARKVLKDLADADLEARASAVFIRLIRAMEGDAKESLAKALTSSADPPLVRSAFGLPDHQRAEIQDAINVMFSADVNLKFETSPELVAGIELTASGIKVAWSISEYLGSLEKSVGKLLKAQTKPKPGTEPGPGPGTEAAAVGNGAVKKEPRHEAATP